MLENIVLNRLQIGTNSLYVFAFFYREKKTERKKNTENQTFKNRGLCRLFGFFFAKKKTAQYCTRWLKRQRTGIKQVTQQEKAREKVK